ncbi:MAG: radical SAM protein [Chloroflexota bacterium]
MISIWQPIFDNAIHPIYRQDQLNRSLFYAPGWLVIVPSGMASDFQATIKDSARADWPEAVELRRRAVEAQETWEGLRTAAFTPLCLTLYLNNTCNLNCVYCFSRSSRSRREPLSLEAIRAAAEIVAQNCSADQKPMTVVFHGGGEPTLNYALIEQALDALEGMATDYNLDLFRYIATNGVLSVARACGLASRFDLIGLSCDGLPGIQNFQRPLQKDSKHTSSWFVERTAHIVHLAKKPLHVRVTITPETIDRQAEIAEYICQTLTPQEIHVEPVYTVEGDETKSRFQPTQAESYMEAFLQARQAAREYGIPWLASSSRPAEIHSTYCHIWRRVLNLTPEGVATLCFKLSDGESVHQQGFDLGHWNPLVGRFELRVNQIQDLCQKIETENEDCALCFNRYHCVRQCPDVCMLRSRTEVAGFRCQVQSMLADTLIQETADALCMNTSVQRPIIGIIPACL